MGCVSLSMVFKTIGFHEIFLRKRRWPKIGAKKLLEISKRRKRQQGEMARKIVR